MKRHESLSQNDDFDIEAFAEELQQGKGNTAQCTSSTAQLTYKKKSRKKKNRSRNRRAATVSTGNPPLQDATSNAEKYMPLLALVDNYCAYIDSSYKEVSHAVGIYKETGESVVLAGEVIATACRDTIKFLQDKVQQLVQAKITINEYLQSLLELRRQSIIHRQDQIKQWLSGTQKKFAAWPRDKFLFRFMTADLGKDYRAKIERTLEQSLQRNELLVTLIHQAVRCSTKQELSENTLNLLRASTALHTVLQEESIIHINHSDHGTFYKVLRHLLPEDINPEKWNHARRKHLARKLCSLQVWKEHYESRLKGLEGQRHNNIALIVLLTDMIESKQLCEEKAKEIQALEKNLEACISLEKQWIPNTRLRKKGFWKKPTLPSLPANIVFAQPDLADYKKSSQPAVAASRPTQATTVATKFAATTEHKEKVLKPGGLEQPDVEAKSHIPSTTLPPRTQPVERPVSHPAATTQRITAAELPSNEDDAYLQTFLHNWNMPAGLRKFRSDLLTRGYVPGSYMVKGKHQSILQQLFNDAQATNLSTAPILSAWQNIGGTIQNAKGSHLLLIGPRGEKVSSIWRLHGRDRYAKGYIPYLRMPFLYMGYRPAK
ncbi:MAG: hypothetical protein AAFP93_00160 [Bacteroidota bacterium]